jgi:hypothetical protein
MNTKLTLTLDKNVIESAKKYARKRDRSLSDLVENYLKLLTDEKSYQSDKSDSKIQKLKGSFKMPKDFDYKEALSNMLIEKHLI